MKIGIIAPIFNTFGGAEKYIITLAEELAKSHEVFVITTAGSTKFQDKKNPNLRIIEITPRNVGSLYNMMANKSTENITLKKMLWHFFDIWNISSYIQIKKILVEEKPDLIYINGIKGISSSVFSIVKKLIIPHTYMIHDFELVSRWSSLFRNGKIIKHFNVLDRLYLNYMRRATRGITTVISPSKFMMDHHVNLGFFEKSNRYIVPNGIRLNNKSKIKKNNETNFLFIGNIEEHKGPQIAVKAFKRLKNKKVKLHLVGKGNYLGELKKIIGNDKQILLHGFVPDDELEEIFERCSYVVFPSIWYENFPLVINEVMSRGLPVIASNLGGLPELIKDGYNGFLFRPGDVACLQNLIEKIFEDREMLSRLSRNAIESSKRFSLETQMESIMNIFSKTVSLSS